MRYLAVLALVALATGCDTAFGPETSISEQLAEAQRQRVELEPLERGFGEAWWLLPDVDSPNMSEDWRPFAFNGQVYYWVPLAH